MDISINFLKDRQKKLTKQQLLDLRAWQISAGIFGVVILVALSMAGVAFWQNRRLAQFQDQRALLKKQVLSQEEIERSYVIFAHKLKTLRQLLDQRSDKQQAITFFSSLFGPDVAIREISYDADDSLVSFGLRSKSVFVLESVFAQLDSPQIKQQFKDLSRSELRRTNEGTYDLKVTVVLNQAGAAAATN